MQLRYLTIFLVTLFSLSVNAQKTLFSIDGETYKVDQFRYLYEKNNQDEDKLYSESSINEYLDLFINLKLKVKEAESLGLHEQANFQKELNQYRSQVAETYLVDRSATKELVEEAYQRSKKEIKCAHILVSCAEDAMPVDSTLAYTKAMQLRDRVLNGENFFKLAKQESDDPSAEQNQGRLGFSTVFRFIYEFENGMYNTPIGDISKPIRTKYGYHLIKVIDERPSLGQVNASQLKVNLPVYGKTAMKEDAKEKCDSIHQLITSGVYTFEEATKLFSDDASTSKRGGNLGWLNANKKGKKFDELVFNMKEGEISAPMRIGNGVYIFKLNKKKPIGTFEEMQEELKKKVEKNSRSQLARNVFVQKLKKNYGYKEYADNTKNLHHNFNETLLLGKWVKKKDDKWNRKIFSIDDTPYTLGEFADFVMQTQKKERISQFEAVVKKYFNNFVAEQLIKTEDKNLENKYPEFKRLMQEFYDGILMFELTSKQVFQQSVDDSIGLQTFYLSNKEKYSWDERLQAKKFRCKNAQTAKTARKELKTKDDDLVYEMLNKDGKINIRLVEDKKFEKGDDEIIDAIEWKKGISRVIQHRDKNFYLVKVIKLLEPETKSFEEAKSEAINDFQNKLSNDLVKQLRDKYKVKVEKKALKKLYKKKK